MKKPDYAPDTIDSLYDTLEYPDSAAKTIAEISSVEAGWLALHIRKQNEAARELVGEEIAKELKVRHPPIHPALPKNRIELLFLTYRRRVLNATSELSASSRSKTRLLSAGRRTGLQH